MKTFDALVYLATKRALTRLEVEEFCARQGISITSWLMTHAHVIGSRFLLKTLTWDEASSALNRVWPMIAKDTELPPFFFDVYLAFEDAETLGSDAERIAFSQNRLLQLRILPDIHTSKA